MGYMRRAQQHFWDVLSETGLSESNHGKTSDKPKQGNSKKQLACHIKKYQYPSQIKIEKLFQTDGDQIKTINKCIF